MDQRAVTVTRFADATRERMLADDGRSFQSMIRHGLIAMAHECPKMVEPRFNVLNLADDRTLRSIDKIARAASMIARDTTLLAIAVERYAQRIAAWFHERRTIRPRCIKRATIAETRSEGPFNVLQAEALIALESGKVAVIERALDHALSYRVTLDALIDSYRDAITIARQPERKAS